MMVEIDGVNVIELIEMASIVGGIVSMLVIGLLIYLLVRPPRHVREAKSRPVEIGASEAEMLLGLMDRMESRLEVLERALADETDGSTKKTQPILEMADDGQESRRIK
jgi:hypothetical protein